MSRLGSPVASENVVRMPTRTATAGIVERMLADIRELAPKIDARIAEIEEELKTACMRLEDGMVMQIHPGALRNHNREVFKRYGRDTGADIPRATDYVSALRPLLDRYGNERDLTIILFTLDESAYSRELAPLAGHYPCLRLGPPWWFHDSPEGMQRFRSRDRQNIGPQGYRESAHADSRDCRRRSHPFAAHRIDQRAGRNLAGHAGNCAGAERSSDCALGPPRAG